MKTWVRKSLNVGVLSAGFLLVSGGAAHADWTTGNNAGVGDGNQLDTKLQVPVDVSGNALGLLGFANAQSGGGAVANTESANSAESWTTGYNAGLLNGNQLSNTVQVPVDVSGNAIGILGFASAQSGGGAVANTGGVHRGHGGESTTLERHHGGNGNGNGSGNGGAWSNGNGGGNWTTGYNAGVLNGNQASNTIQVPIDLCGNAISVGGFSSASCAGGSWANAESASTESAQTEDWTSGFNAGVANGNQISNVLQVPINVCGNSIAVLGFADASCGGGAVANTGGMGNGMGNGDDNGGRHHHHNGGWDGDGNGDDNGGYDGNGGANGGYDGNGGANGGYDGNGGANGDGDGNGNGGHHGNHGGNGGANGGWGNGNGGANAGGGACGDWTTGYNSGLLTGNQTGVNVQVPVNISGNAISVLGQSFAQSAGGAVAHSC
jgi:hypothetical protein